MQFDKNIPIYLQIEDFVRDKILQNIWLADERLPSVRELAVTLEVNPNTVMRSYENLERNQIIYNQRGVGFFVSAQAEQAIKQIRIQAFFEQLPQLFKTMKTLNINMEEIQIKWKEFMNHKIETL